MVSRADDHQPVNYTLLAAGKGTMTDAGGQGGICAGKTNPDGQQCIQTNRDCFCQGTTPHLGLIKEQSEKNKVDPKLVERIVWLKSRNNPQATNGKYQGLMGLGPQVPGRYGYTLEDRLDPAKNIDMGTRYLREIIDENRGDIEKAIINYNAGKQAVRDWEKAGRNNESLVDETKNYKGFVHDNRGFQQK